MKNKKGNFAGVLFTLLMLVAIFALLTSEPKTTGFAVLEKETKGIPKQINSFCAGNIAEGKCSNTKPLFCNNGDLTYNCYECGCNQGETCGQFGVCEKIEKCTDGSIYGECSFLKGKFCNEGTLVDYCELCGCDEGKVCNSGKCVQ